MKLDLSEVSREYLEAFCEGYVECSHGPAWYLKTGLRMMFERAIGRIGDLIGRDWWP